MNNNKYLKLNNRNRVNYRNINNLDTLFYVNKDKKWIQENEDTKIAKELFESIKDAICIYERINDEKYRNKNLILYPLNKYNTRFAVKNSNLYYSLKNKDNWCDWYRYEEINEYTDPKIIIEILHSELDKDKEFIQDIIPEIPLNLKSIKLKSTNYEEWDAYYF